MWGDGLVKADSWLHRWAIFYLCFFLFPPHFGILALGNVIWPGTCECKYLPKSSFAALILPKCWSYTKSGIRDYNIDITWNSRNLEKTNFLMHSLASIVLLGCRNKTLLFWLQVGCFFRAQLVLPSSSERPLWTVVHAQAPPPDPWSWGEIRLGIRKGVAIVCSDHGFQVWAGLQEVSKAAHLPLLKWAIQHFVFFAAKLWMIVEVSYVKMTCHLLINTFPQLW